MKKLLAAVFTLCLCWALMFCAAPAAEAATLTKETVSETIVFDPIANSDELLTGFLYGSRGISTYSSDAMVSRLGNGVNKALYIEAKRVITDIANGRENTPYAEIDAKTCGIDPDVYWSAEELGVATIVSGYDSSGKPVISADAFKAVGNRIGLDRNLVFHALRADCPFEMYWCYNSVYYSFCQLWTNEQTGEHFLGPSDTISIKFPVVPEYCDDDGYHVDVNKTHDISSAIANARQIIEDYAEYSDCEKLEGYAKELCKLNTYNSDAANSGPDVYGDPWQIIYMFDGNNQTNVVCEGYSKSFQYLCEMTFDPDNIWVYSVSGNFSSVSVSGPHMWNIVRMDDGRNYLVDVTNYDLDLNFSPYVDEALFLAPAISGTARTGYAIHQSYGSDFHYSYASYTESLFTEDELSLSYLKYGDTLQKAETPATCTTNGYQAHYEFGDRWFADKTAVTPIKNHDSILIPAGHKLGDIVPASAATCTEDGNIAYYTCSVCQKNFADADGTQPVDDVTDHATGHEFTPVSTPATCTENGWAEHYECSKCNEWFTFEETPVLIENRDTLVIPAKHTLDEIPAKTARCTEGGWNTHFKCSVCKKLFADAKGQNEVAIEDVTTGAAGHNTTFHDAKDPSCKTGGTKAYYECENCQQKFIDSEGTQPAGNVEIPAGHTPETIPAVPATCTAPGKTAGSRCKVCGDILTNPTDTEPVPHNYGEPLVTPATRDTDGSITKKCENEGCSEEIVDKILKIAKIELESETYPYTGKKITPTVKAVDSDGKVISSSYYTITCEGDCIEKGKYTATVTFTDHYDGSVNLTFEITEPMPKTVKLTTTAYTYNGSVKKPTVIVQDENGVDVDPANYTVKYASGRKNVGKYSVTVTFTGKYSGSKTLTFKINPVKTALSKLTAGKKSFTAKWKKKATQTTGYQIQYSLKKDFKSAKTVTIKKNSTVSKLIKSLKSGKTYYVRIQTYKTVNGEKFYSGWSKAKSIKVK